METNTKKLGAMKLKQVIDGCNTVLGTLKIRIEDMDESGEIIKAVRLNLAQCSAYIQADLINAFEEGPAPIEEVVPVEEVPEEEKTQLAEEEVVADDGNSYGEPESESEPAADEPVA